MDSSSERLFAFLSYSLQTAETTFYKLPGSAVVARYVKSSHQNDPGRTLLEVILIIFAIRTLLQSRTRAERAGKHFIQFSDKASARAASTNENLLNIFLGQEIDELVDEWTPEPLAKPLDTREQAELLAVPIIAGPNGPKPKLVNTGKTAINLASFNFTGLSGNDNIKELAVNTLRKYGLGSCGPPGFYGTLGTTFVLTACSHRLTGRRQTFISNSSGTSPVFLVLKQPYCTLKDTPPSTLSSLPFANVVISSWLTEVSTSPFKKAYKSLAQLSDGSIIMI